MPLVKIYSNNKIVLTEKKIVSDAIHESLQKNFNVPIKDIFHLWISYLENEFIYNKDYLLSENKSRTNNLIYIDILCGKGRNTEQKKKLFKDIAKKISEKTTILIEDIFITIKETEMEDWSFGEGIAQMIEERSEK